MNHHIRRRRDTFIRIKGFGQEYAGDFPLGSVEAEQLAEIDAVIDLIEQLGGEQAAEFGNVRFNFHGKAIARENLREDLNDISDLAGAMAYATPGFDLKFHIPKNLPDAALLALARAFAEQGVGFRNEFVRYGLSATFLNDLQAAIDAFESSLTPPGMALDAQVEATARLGEAVRRGMIARNILNEVLKVKYKNDVGKLRAWLCAGHIEKHSVNGSHSPPKTS